jgi:hypothetical protein
MEKINNKPIINHGIDTQQFTGNPSTQANKSAATNQTNFNQGSMSDKTLFNSGDQMRTNLDGQLFAKRFSNAERAVIDRNNPDNYDTTITRSRGDRDKNDFTIGMVTRFTQGDPRWAVQHYRFANPNNTHSNMIEEACSITAYTNAINAVNLNNRSSTFPIINPQDTNLRSDAFEFARKQTKVENLMGNGAGVLNTNNNPARGRTSIPFEFNRDGSLGISNSKDNSVANAIVRELRAGNPVLIGITGPNGHRHTVTAYGLDGNNILVVDAGASDGEGSPIQTNLADVARTWSSNRIDMVFAIKPDY